MDVTGLHPNAQRMLGLAAAWNAGDVEKMMSYFAEHPVYHVAGRSPVSGTYRGRDEVEQLAHRLIEITGDDLKIQPLDILADDRNVVVVYRLHGSRGTRSVDVTVAGASEFGADGKVEHVWYLADDQRAYDEFFS